MAWTASATGGPRRADPKPVAIRRHPQTASCQLLRTPRRENQPNGGCLSITKHAFRALSGETAETLCQSLEDSSGLHLGTCTKCGGQCGPPRSNELASRSCAAASSPVDLDMDRSYR